MAYSYLSSAGVIIESVKQRLKDVPKFIQMESLRLPELYYDFLNDCLAELSADAGFEWDIWSINTVVATYEYPLDGTSNNFPDEVDEIIAVEYDGVRLDYRYFYPDQLQEPTTDDSGAPDGWYEKWDGGKRYLGLNAQPDEVVALKIIGTRKPVHIIASAGVPAVQSDFRILILNMVIRECLKIIGLADPQYWLLKQKWNEEEVQPWKERVANAMKKRQGKRVHEVGIMGADDIFEA